MPSVGCPSQLPFKAVARKIDPDELVDQGEAAAIIGLGNPKGVSVYRKRYEDFPRPVIEKGRCLLWLRADVEMWVRSRR